MSTTAGGGLVMVGGPESFGAGGWIGSPLEDALPVRLDPPQKRQMPRGALALVIHSVEMPEGVFYGQEGLRIGGERALAAGPGGDQRVQRDGRRVDWVHPLREVGDGQRGQAGDPEPAVRRHARLCAVAQAGVRRADRRRRCGAEARDHDLRWRSLAAVAGSCCRSSSTPRSRSAAVGVVPALAGDDQSTMKYIAEYTGGRYYEVTRNAALADPADLHQGSADGPKRSADLGGDGVRARDVGGAWRRCAGITQRAADLRVRGRGRSRGPERR
jgi:hypothetical protein